MSSNNPVEIIQFQGVCLWKTETTTTTRKGLSSTSSSVNSDLCAICRSEISDYCVECATTVAHGPMQLLPSQIKEQHQRQQQQNKNENEKQNDKDRQEQEQEVIKCNVCTGACGHAFHKHCVSGWLRNHSVCPLCHDPWEQVGEDLDRSALL